MSVDVIRGNCNVSTDLIAPRYIVSGSQTVAAGRVLNEDGTYALNEDGGYALPESPIYVLNENGTYALDENGDRQLEEGSPSADGHATALVSSSTPCQALIIAAKIGNYDPIWISGSDVADGVGVPLYPGENPVSIPVPTDLNKFYIWGTAGEGVTFFYETVDLTGDLTFLGIPLTFGGTPLSP